MRSVIASILGLLVCLFAGSDLDSLRLPVICVFAYLGLDAVFSVAEMGRVKSTLTRGSATADAKQEKAAVSNLSTTTEEQAAVLGFLSQLQARGRILDFVMEDIANYTDAQVGAAARVVHQGCRGLFDECFALSPVDVRGEGSPVVVKKGFDPHQLRLIGRSDSGEEFSGRLVHKGWKTSKISLPKLLTPIEAGAMVIHPAEIEVKG